MLKRGLFIVFEGIDGSGTTTQVRSLHDEIKKLSPYNDVLTTCEHWKDEEIQRRLREDQDAYSSGKEMARLYVEDRKQHQEKLIIPNLNAGVIVLSDRYMLSTFAYQGVQGVSYETIRKLHQEADIIRPDLTFFLDTSLPTARARLQKRGGDLQKFEREMGFTRELIKKYRFLYTLVHGEEDFFGPIVRVDGNKSKKDVLANIMLKFGPFYDLWVS